MDQNFISENDIMFFPLAERDEERVIREAEFFVGYQDDKVYFLSKERKQTNVDEAGPPKYEQIMRMVRMPIPSHTSTSVDSLSRPAAREVIDLDFNDTKDIFSDDNGSHYKKVSSYLHEIGIPGQDIGFTLIYHGVGAFTFKLLFEDILSSSGQNGKPNFSIFRFNRKI